VIVKTWACLNRNCLKVYDSTAGEFPPCPRCGMIRVKWVPRPVAIKSERTKQIDATVKELKETYGYKNYRSPVRGQAAAATTNRPAGSRAQRFVPKGYEGWGADVPLDANGNFTAHCAPTGVTAKLKVEQGQRASTTRVGDRTIGVGGNVEYSHRPAGGVPK